MSDLRFGRSETNIWMVRTFAFFGSGHNITCTFTCTRVTELGVVSVDVTQKLSWQRYHRHPEQSEKYVYKQSLEEINIITGCLLKVSKAWNRHVIFWQYNIIS